MSKASLFKSILLLAEQIADIITMKMMRRMSKRGQELMNPVIKWILATLLGGVLIYIAWRALSPERGEETAQQLADALKGQQEPLT
ncbi:TPA: hypothetical protein HA249_00245 [Candidatus Woesearchaeota archaeon]|nr:MAG: hypothetical protein QT07_C0007G0033 [archaeon GW2011_AR16]HIG95307.1 hypothetical protein [Candidatus Woesearchaeota archaeon]HIH46948.1 hypothetical protein [Candidatus Woesearchaeota archaeon]HII89326.1 hypothetical protein [Candidatus Woesearchaeota archaeon]